MEVEEGEFRNCYVGDRTRQSPDCQAIAHAASSLTFFESLVRAARFFLRFAMIVIFRLIENQHIAFFLFRPKNYYKLSLTFSNTFDNLYKS